MTNVPVQSWIVGNDGTMTPVDPVTNKPIPGASPVLTHGDPTATAAAIVNPQLLPQNYDQTVTVKDATAVNALGNAVGTGISDVAGFLAAHPALKTALALGGSAIVGAAAAGTVGKLLSRRGKTSKRRVSKSRKTSSRTRGRKLKFGSPAFRRKYLGKNRGKKRG